MGSEHLAEDYIVQLNTYSSSKLISTSKLTRRRSNNKQKSENYPKTTPKTLASARGGLNELLRQVRVALTEDLFSKQEVYRVVLLNGRIKAQMTNENGVIKSKVELIEWQGSGNRGHSLLVKARRNGRGGGRVPEIQGWQDLENQRSTFTF